MPKSKRKPRAKATRKAKTLPVREEAWIHRSTGKRVRVWLQYETFILAYQVEDGIVFRDSRLLFLNRETGPFKIPEFEPECYFELSAGTRSSDERPPGYREDVDQCLSSILFRLTDWQEYHLRQMVKKFSDQRHGRTGG